MRTHRSPDERSPRRAEGAAALEFAIACPLLFLIFLGMVEIGAP